MVFTLCSWLGGTERFDPLEIISNSFTAIDEASSGLWAISAENVDFGKVGFAFIVQLENGHRCLRVIMSCRFSFKPQIL